MGYTTDFEGVFKLNKKLTPKLQEYLTKFSNTRRMARKLPKKFGTEGEFYVDGGGMSGQDREDSIIDYNHPPSTQPGLWCQWKPTEDGMGIEWDGGEKFYNYVEWLQYIVSNFLEPKGYTLNGNVSWQGEDRGDVGIIEVKDNNITTYDGVIKLADNVRVHNIVESIRCIFGCNIDPSTRAALTKYISDVLNGQR
jgi:hypothetical protein